MQQIQYMYVYLISPRNRRLYIRYEYIYGYYYACKEGDMQHKSDIYMYLISPRNRRLIYMDTTICACKEGDMQHKSEYIYIERYLSNIPM